jgi:hypothetical protein
MLTLIDELQKEHETILKNLEQIRTMDGAQEVKVSALMLLKKMETH